MENALISNIVNICKILDKHDIQYLIVGGTAVALHGYFRVTMLMDGKPADKHDLDFWYEPTYENYYNLLNALEELGLDVKEFRKENSPNPKKSFFKFETDTFTLDFLPEIVSIKRFGPAFRKREKVVIENIEIGYLDYEDLIKEKQENARAKDLIDIQQLNLIKGKQGDDCSV